MVGVWTSYEGQRSAQRFGCKEALNSVPAVASSGFGRAVARIFQPNRHCRRSIAKLDCRERPCPTIIRHHRRRCRCRCCGYNRCCLVGSKFDRPCGIGHDDAPFQNQNFEIPFEPPTPELGSAKADGHHRRPHRHGLRVRRAEGPGFGEERASRPVVDGGIALARFVVNKFIDDHFAVSADGQRRLVNEHEADPRLSPGLDNVVLEYRAAHRHRDRLAGEIDLRLPLYALDLGDRFGLLGNALGAMPIADDAAAAVAKGRLRSRIMTCLI